MSFTAVNMYRKYFQLPQQFLNVVTPLSQSTLLKVNHENHIPKRWAGHSKWQNIKSTKEAKDRNKSESFRKLVQQIMSCVRKDGPNPDTNSRLKSLIEESRKINMPKTTLEGAIKSAHSRTTDKPYWTIFSGPKGVVLGLEVAFANKKLGFLQGKLVPYTKKLNFKLEQYYDHLCCEKGLIIADPLDKVKNPYETAIEDAIEIGMDEVHENDDKSFLFECPADRLEAYAKKISEKGYNIQSSSVELDFKNFVALDQQEIENIEKLITSLQNRFDEILRASYNLAQE